LAKLGGRFLQNEHLHQCSHNGTLNCGKYPAAYSSNAISKELLVGNKKSSRLLNIFKHSICILNSEKFDILFRVILKLKAVKRENEQY
jgi:hypothetical protein